MSRPRTKGEPLLFRPPVHIYDALVRLANKAGVSVNTYAEKVLSEHVAATAPKPRGRSTKPFLGGYGDES